MIGAARRHDEPQGFLLPHPEHGAHAISQVAREAKAVCLKMRRQGHLPAVGEIDNNQDSGVWGGMSEEHRSAQDAAARARRARRENTATIHRTKAGESHDGSPASFSRAPASKAGSRLTQRHERAATSPGAHSIRATQLAAHHLVNDLHRWALRRSARNAPSSATVTFWSRPPRARRSRPSRLARGIAQPEVLRPTRGERSPVPGPDGEIILKF